MKKLYVAVFLLLVGIVFAAVWFSPLTALGEPHKYDNNEPVFMIDGLCYASGDTVRVDFSGGEDDMYSALDRIGASTVKTVYAGDVLIVYAYSPRVCGSADTLSSGEVYNVMAAYADGNIAVGTPILSGCY